MSGGTDSTTIVIATHNRRARLLATLDILRALPERPSIIVVDNGSSDDTAAAVCARRDANVRVIGLPHNIGAPARNVGVRAAPTPYVAFTDDDSWFAPGAITGAERRFDVDPRLALVAAAVRVGPEERPDPMTTEMENTTDGGRQPVFGFLACGAFVRKRAFLSVGGFSTLLTFPGEERLLTLDLLTAGWWTTFAPDVVAHHHPPQVTRAGRAVLERRNDLLTTWMRRRGAVVCRQTARLAVGALVDADDRRALFAALQRLPAALARRKVIDQHLDARATALGW